MSENIGHRYSIHHMNHICQNITNNKLTIAANKISVMDPLPTKLRDLLNIIVKDHVISSWRIQERNGLFCLKGLTAIVNSQVGMPNE